MSSATFLKEDPTGQDLALKGDTPFSALIESLAEQFEEFNTSGEIQSDTSNYFDSMNDALAVSDQINKTPEYQFDAEVVSEMKELFDNTAMSLMDSAGLDLSQTNDPKSLMYILYTNFMLTNQRQHFFNYVVRAHVKSDGLETDLAIAHGKMLENDPEDMYHMVSNMVTPAEDTIPYIVPFLRDSGLSDILPWVEEGWLPEDIILEKFLNANHSFDVMFTTYFQMEKELLYNE